MACDTAIQRLCNDGCTAASSPYPYGDSVGVALILVYLQHAGGVRSLVFQVL
jgi:hypothetical protein